MWMPVPQPPAAARVMRTSFASRPVIVMQETVYFFVQNPALGQLPVVWRVSVWQLQLAPELPARLTPEIPSKSI
jgi:hypothetical protein